MPSASAKVCVIGLDGATFDVLDRWVGAGEMPNLARLMERSARADLLSTVPPVTGPAWTSMTTGVNPGRHGIFDFVKVRDSGTKTRLVNSRDVLPPRIWDLFQQAGYGVGVYRVPVTYPATAVNGFMVTGLLTPPRGRYLSHPPELADTIRAAGKHWLHPLGDREGVVGRPPQILSADRSSMAVLRKLLEQFQPSFFMGVNSELDHMQHRAWAHCIGADGSEGTPEWETVRQFFRSLDDGIGWLVDFFGPEAYVFVASDHGFGHLDAVFGMNEWLAAHGYIKLRRARLGAYKLHVRAARAAKRALEAMGLLEAARAVLRKLRVVPDASSSKGSWVRHPMANLVDWSRTSALLRSSSAQGLYLNTPGRSLTPTLLTPQDRQDLLARLKADLLAIDDPETGEPLVTFLRDRDEVFEGPYVHDAPDLFLAMRNDAVAPVSYTGRPGWLGPTNVFSGVHRPNGVFLAAGPDIRPEVVPDLNILDVAPTVLHAAGLAVPRYMEGQVRMDLFREGTAAGGEVRYSDAELDLSAAGKEPEFAEAEDTREVEKRLRDLGYL
jgi:predicted AlkP superfamily phosphohydrolase/phosphomutase